MGVHAWIEHGAVSIDTVAWLQQRTAGRRADLTGDLHAWATSRHRDATGATVTSVPPRLGRYAWQQAVLDWCAVRGHAGPDPRDPLGGPVLVAHEMTRLQRDLWLACALTPDGGRIVVVQVEDDAPVVYTDDARELADWFDADTVQIACPNGHGWWWRTGRELLTADGTFTTLTGVWGANLDAPFSRCRDCVDHDTGHRSIPCGCDGTPWIVCPTCGQRCDVELAPY